jgi:hypothetical protein
MSEFVCPPFIVGSVLVGTRSHVYIAFHLGSDREQRMDRRQEQIRKGDRQATDCRGPVKAMTQYDRRTRMMFLLLVRQTARSALKTLGIVREFAAPIVLRTRRYDYVSLIRFW